MRRLLFLAALMGCTGTNEAAPDERCEPFELEDVPEGARVTAVDAAGYQVAYWLPDGAEFSVWPRTRTPQSYLLNSAIQSDIVEWGCWPGGSLAFECSGIDCTCYESGQSWKCPHDPGGWFSAVEDAVKANGPYVTQ